MSDMPRIELGGEPISLVAAPVAQPAPAEAEAQPVAKRSKIAGALPWFSPGLALLATSLSVGALIHTDRTVTKASLVVADARERGEQLAQVGALIHELEDLRVRETSAMERIAFLSGNKAVTIEEVNNAINGLKLDLAKEQRDGGAMALVRDGQAELAERIGQIALKTARIEAAVSSSRKGRSEAGQEPTS